MLGLRLPPLFFSFRFKREKDQANKRTRRDDFSGANFFSLVQARRYRFFLSVVLLLCDFVASFAGVLALFVSDFRGPFFVTFDLLSYSGLL